MNNCNVYIRFRIQLYKTRHLGAVYNAADNYQGCGCVGGRRAGGKLREIQGHVSLLNLEEITEYVIILAEFGYLRVNLELTMNHNDSLLNLLIYS